MFQPRRDAESNETKTGDRSQLRERVKKRRRKERDPKKRKKRKRGAEVTRADKGNAYVYAFRR